MTLTMDEAVSQALAKFARLWRPPAVMDAETVELWASSLERINVPAERVAGFAGMLVDRHVGAWFPTPAELGEIAREVLTAEAETRAEEERRRHPQHVPTQQEQIAAALQRIEVREKRGRRGGSPA